MVSVAEGPPGPGGPAHPMPPQGSVLAQAGSENFPVATRLLPPRTRAHLLALYGYARLVDDTGDDPAAAPPARLAGLAAVEADLERIYDGSGDPQLAVMRALAPTVRACGIPRGPLARLVEANRRDQVINRYPSFDALVEYCTFSADPVGELVLHVFGAASPRRVRLSNRICTALQVLEHCQDVGEDAARGRVYLPQADLDEAGVSQAELTAPSASPALRAVVRRQVDRARRLLDEGTPLVGALHGLGRLTVAGYLAGGQATAAALAAAGYDVLAHRVRPAKGRLLVEWGRLLVGGGRR